MSLYKKIVYILILVIAVYLAFLYGKAESSLGGLSITSAQTTASSTSFAGLDEVRGLIDSKFISWKATYTPPTTKELEYGIIRGYVDAYKDPYTTYFPPVEAEQFAQNVKGSFGGVGMEVGIKDKLITIIAPLKSSPAEKAGVKAGDMILSVGDKDISGMSVEQAVGLIRGDIGTSVTFKIYRPLTKETKSFTIIRQEIKIPTIDTETKNGVFVIHLYNFSAESPEMFRKALVEFTKSNSKYLMIDLRGNPGGYLESSVQIASYFIPQGGVIVEEKGNREYGANIHRSLGYAGIDTSKIKIGVLIDEGSASASEILAGAMKDQKIATVLGQKSFGKGSVQEFITLANGGALKVTVATWYTPNGVSITKDGVTPDIELKRAPHRQQ
jgi:carboxyl-terminal processing protease